MRKRTQVTTGLASLFLLALPAIAAAQLQNGAYTPGAADKVDVKKLCAAGLESSSKPVSGWQRDEALTRYGIRPESFDGALERLIPASLGGNNDPANLFPFHPRGEFTLDAKKELGDKLHQLVCDGKLPLKDAQALFKKDWTKAYKQYMQPLNAPGN